MGPDSSEPVDSRAGTPEMTDLAPSARLQMRATDTPALTAAFGQVSVVMPCFNEEKTIAAVIARVLASPFVGQLVVVDDGSTDRSVELIRKIDDARLELLAQPRNMGKGAALRRGIIDARLSYVLIQDADLEYDPAEYPALLTPLVDGRADVVFGSRFHTSRPHRVLYYWHSIGNRLLTTLSNMLTNLNLSDMETGYKVFRREVIQGIAINEDRFGFEPEITAKVARGGWRVYEVGISYSGRTYAEGKKIGWRDGVRAFYCIARYAIESHLPPPMRPAVPASFDEADGPLQDSLDSLEGAPNYTAWLAELMAPHLRGRILELGAGHGTLSERLATHGQLVATDLSDLCVQRLRSRFAGRRDVEVVRSNLVDGVGDRTFDAVVMVNLLEHIEEDVAALAQVSDRLEADGHLLVLVPAFERLYSRFDGLVGHQRRYTRSQLIGTAYRAGLEVIEARYVNSVGTLAWWTLARQLERIPTRPWSAHAYDKLVIPWLRRLEAAHAAPVGQSILLVARRRPNGRPVPGDVHA